MKLLNDISCASFMSQVLECFTCDKETCGVSEHVTHREAIHYFRNWVGHLDGEGALQLVVGAVWQADSGRLYLNMGARVPYHHHHIH